MGGIAYLDFDLQILHVGAGYRVQVLASPGGQAFSEFTLPFSDLELENFLLRMGRPRRGVRRADVPEVEAAKKFGGSLFSAVFRDEVLACWRTSLDEAARSQSGLRVRLRLTDAPELADIPWEFLYNAAHNQFLTLSNKTPLVRYLEMAERIQPLAVEPPLRILVVISSPSNYPALAVEQEWAKLSGALNVPVTRGLLQLERMEGATLGELQRGLRQRDFHIFHFIGHAFFDPGKQDGFLIFEDQDKRGRAVSGQDLGVLLHDHQPMRLAVLNACEGARASRNDPFAGAAQSLTQQGLPAVIAMQFEITDEAAILFAQEFYSAVADGYPVDAALAESRKTIFTQGYSPEWGTPVLYLRAHDGKIFDVQRRPESAAQPPVLPAIIKQEVSASPAILPGEMASAAAAGGSALPPQLAGNPPPASVVVDGALQAGRKSPAIDVPIATPPPAATHRPPQTQVAKPVIPASPSIVHPREIESKRKRAVNQMAEALIPIAREFSSIVVGVARKCEEVARSFPALLVAEVGRHARVLKGAAAGALLLAIIFTVAKVIPHHMPFHSTQAPPPAPASGPATTAPTAKSEPAAAAPPVAKDAAKNPADTVPKPPIKTPVEPKPTRVSENVMRTKLLHVVTPEYPPIARATHVEGTVTLEALIARDGTVKRVKYLSGPPILMESSLQAVRDWRYETTLVDGKPLEVITTIDVKYHLTTPAPSSAAAPAPSAAPKIPAAALQTATPAPESGPVASSTAPVKLPAEGTNPCSLGAPRFKNEGSRLIVSVPYNYRGTYKLGTVALRGFPLDANKEQIPGLAYQETTLNKAGGTAHFSIERPPSLSHKSAAGEYLVIVVAVKESGQIVCRETLPYPRQW